MCWKCSQSIVGCDESSTSLFLGGISGVLMKLRCAAGLACLDGLDGRECA